jgi:hypothetical protein
LTSESFTLCIDVLPMKFSLEQVGALGVTTGVGVGVGVTTRDGVGVGVGVGVTPDVGVGTRDGVGVGVTTGAGDATGVAATTRIKILKLLALY